MDGHKLEKLNSVKWRLAQSCQTCNYFESTPKKAWGLCGHADNLYEHRKHQRTHQLPAHIHAVCDFWEPDPTHQAILQGFLDSPLTS